MPRHPYEWTVIQRTSQPQKVHCFSRLIKDILLESGVDLLAVHTDLFTDVF
jgi:hypothetical protein